MPKSGREDTLPRVFWRGRRDEKARRNQRVLDYHCPLDSGLDFTSAYEERGVSSISEVRSLEISQMVCREHGWLAL